MFEGDIPLSLRLNHRHESHGIVVVRVPEI
jgi:hypothetical protein